MLMLLEVTQTSNFTDKETEVKKRRERNEGIGYSLLLLLSLIFLVQLGLLNMGF